jgi:hypothetical protein
VGGGDGVTDGRFLDARARRLRGPLDVERVIGGRGSRSVLESGRESARLDTGADGSAGEEE